MKKKQLPKIDYGLLGIVLFLVVLGLLALSSASSVLSFERFGHNHFYLLRQISFGAIPGLIMLFLSSRVDYHVWQKFAPLLVLIGIILLAIVLIPGIGFKVGNSRRWIDFGYFLFQPSEFVKLALVFYLASWYDKRKHHATDLYYGFLPSLFIVGLISALIILEPDLGTMVTLASIGAVMFFVGGVKLKYLFSTAAGSLVLLWVLIKAAPYRLQRITAYFNPEFDTQGISYQINQALLAIGSGGLWGTGFGQSRQKFNYLPETIGDSIFAIASEELGFIRISILLLILLFFAFRGFKIARNAPDLFGKLVAAGITSWLVFQSLINIGGITAIIPLAGIPLPFISYGSSALAISLAGIGVLLNISRYSR